MNDNQLKSINGQISKNSLSLQLQTLQANGVIAFCFGEYRNGYENYDRQQFYAPFYIEFQNGEGWLLFSSNSIRNDRMNNQQWNSLHLKKIASNISRAYLVIPDEILNNAAEKRNAENYQKKITGKMYSTIEDVCYQTEIINMIIEHSRQIALKTVNLPNDVISYSVEEEKGEIMMAAENIYIYGSIPVDLPNTKREQLMSEKLELVLMYAIQPLARQKAEVAGKIAIGIKESMLKEEQIASYKGVKYLLFHYWSNPKAYQLTKQPLMVEPDDVPSDYLVRMENDAVRFLLLEYNPYSPSDLGDVDILKTQRRGEIRYLPFVTTIESITKY